MSRSCTVCAHPHRAAIDKALVASASFRDIAGQYALSKSAVERHRGEHLPKMLVTAQAAQEEARALDILQQLKVINASSLAVLRQARDAGDGELALKAVDRIHRQIELQAKLLGELDERPQINILISPEWLTVRGVLLQALAPYPDARTAVAARLGALEATNGQHTP